MVPPSEEHLVTSLRPVASGVIRPLERLLNAGAQVPTLPVARFAEESGEIRQWIETEIDWIGLASLAMTRGVSEGAVFSAEAVLADALGIGPHEQHGPEREWTPQGQVLDAFVGDFLRRARGAAGNDELPQVLRDPEDYALKGAIRRLHTFLSADRLAGSLVAPLSRAVLHLDGVILDDGVRIAPLTDEMKAELWSRHGWGSESPNPLRLHDLLDVTHSVVIDVHGGPLGGWSWVSAQDRVPRVLLALRLLGSGSVYAPWAWLRLDREFADYLGRLGAGGGLTYTGSCLETEQTGCSPLPYAALRPHMSEAPMKTA